MFTKFIVDVIANILLGLEIKDNADQDALLNNLTHLIGDFKNQLLNKFIQVGHQNKRRQTFYATPLTISQACEHRNSIVKALYNR